MVGAVGAMTGIPADGIIADGSRAKKLQGFSCSGVVTIHCRRLVNKNSLIKQNTHFSEVTKAFIYRY